MSWIWNLIWNSLGMILEICDWTSGVANRLRPPFSWPVDLDLVGRNEFTMKKGLFSSSFWWENQCSDIMKMCVLREASAAVMLESFVFVSPFILWYSNRSFSFSIRRTSCRVFLNPLPSKRLQTSRLWSKCLPCQKRRQWYYFQRMDPCNRGSWAWE